jgi:hypothetical protein
MWVPSKDHTQFLHFTRNVMPIHVCHFMNHPRLVRVASMRQIGFDAGKQGLACLFLVLWTATTSLQAQTSSSSAQLRYFNQTSIGLQIGRTTLQPLNCELLPKTYFRNTLLHPTFYTVNGVNWGRKTSIGLGAGLEWLSSGLQFPVFLQWRHTFRQDGVRPYLEAMGGYAIQKESPHAVDFPEAYVEEKGGLLAGLNLGVSLPLGKSTALDMGLGYRYQGLRSTYRGDHCGDMPILFYESHMNHHHLLDVRMGIRFN